MALFASLSFAQESQEKHTSQRGGSIVFFKVVYVHFSGCAASNFCVCPQTGEFMEEAASSCLVCDCCTAHKE